VLKTHMVEGDHGAWASLNVRF